MSEKSKTISQKKADLDTMLAWFEGDDFKIEEAFTKFNKAAKLADEITRELEEYQNKIEVLKQRFDTSA